MNSNIKSVVFDLGNVLIYWNPRYVFNDHYFDSKEKLDFFFDKVCTAEWHEMQDAGRPMVVATEEKVAEFPEWEKAIRDFYGRWDEMFRGPIKGMVEIFRELKKNKALKFYALTNWSAEKFPQALAQYDFLHWFDGRVVSGEEKIRKPFPEIYKRLLTRYELKLNETLFIDDSLRNVKAAEELGIITLVFTSPEKLKQDLRKIGIL